METQQNTGMGKDDHVHEIEARFNVTGENICQIDAIGVSKEPITFVDTYYDYPDNSLACANIWLRMRGKTFELKIPNGDIPLEDKSLSSHTEIFRIDEIANQIGLEITGNDSEDLMEAIKKEGLIPFAAFLIKRQTFLLYQHKVKVDIDSVLAEGIDEERFECKIGEVEYIEVEGSTPEEAISCIAKFKKNLDVTDAPYGKLALYLQARKPKIFELLQSKGIW